MGGAGNGDAGGGQPTEFQLGGGGKILTGKGHRGSTGEWAVGRLEAGRGGQDWWDNGKKMDEDSVRSLISNLRDLSADKFVDSGFTTPEIEATVTSEDGKRVERVQISKSGANYIAKRENDGTLYQLITTAVDDLQKSLAGMKPALAPATKSAK